MSWWQTATPGDKVVCVDDVVGRFNVPGVTYHGYLFGLTAGVVYTVRNVGVLPGGHPRAGEVTVFLSEIIRPKNPRYSGETGFHPLRFRPIQPKSTEKGMAILKSILNGVRVPEDA